jgi:DnaJ-class molecular chaperone
LRYTAQIALRHALCGIKLTLVDVYGDSFTLVLEPPLTPVTVKCVERRGLPDAQTGKRSNLYISFNIEFPTHIPPNAKSALKAALKLCCPPQTDQ